MGTHVPPTVTAPTPPAPSCSADATSTLGLPISTPCVIRSDSVPPPTSEAPEVAAVSRGVTLSPASVISGCSEARSPTRAQLADPVAGSSHPPRVNIRELTSTLLLLLLVSPMWRAAATWPLQLLWRK